MTIRALKGFHPPLVASLAMVAIFSVPCASLAQEQTATPSTSTPDTTRPTTAPDASMQTAPATAEPGSAPETAAPESSQPATPVAKASSNSQTGTASSSMGMGQNTAPDNSGQNKAQEKTAQQQPENTSDRMTTKKVRQAIMADKSLSTYGHNVKIITQNGSVTLKGPVKSEEEKQAIGAKAAEAVGGADKVTNELTVKQ